ncbi:MAG: NapC/NirT family cytochrome c [Gammaproteobacteria bacterium]
MNPMRSQASLILLCILILLLGHLHPVSADTDAELEALEKQIEQQEVDEKKPEMGRTCIDCHKGIAHSLPETEDLTLMKN